MSEQAVGYYDVKQINELNPLYKLNGMEELLIDNGDKTLRVTVDTLLGYIRDTINNPNGSGGSTNNDNPSGGGTVVGGGSTITTPVQTVVGASTIHIIHETEEDVPIESRPEGHYYIRVVNATDAQLSTGMPRLIRVSPNMQLRMIID